MYDKFGKVFITWTASKLHWDAKLQLLHLKAFVEFFTELIISNNLMDHSCKNNQSDCCRMQFRIKYYTTTWVGYAVLPFTFVDFFFIKFQLYPCTKKTLPTMIHSMRKESTYFYLRRRVFSRDFYSKENKHDNIKLLCIKFKLTKYPSLKLILAKI